MDDFENKIKEHMDNDLKVWKPVIIMGYMSVNLVALAVVAALVKLVVLLCTY